MGDRLTDCDCKILQKNFKDISKSVNGKLLLDRLFNNGVITEEDAFRLSEEDVSNEECLQFLICDVLLKHGTYTDLEKFHIALALNKQDDACKFFPSFDREDSDESDKIEDPVENGAPEDKEGEPDTEEGELVADAGMGKTMRKLQSNVVKQVKKFVKPTDKPDGLVVQPHKPANNKGHDRFLSAFVDYQTKANHGPYGRGVCLVFALFTGHLKGYEEDVANIQEFFHGTMGYEVRVHKNLNQTELMKTVKQERDKIENSGYFDRLFVVVLSHGSSDGILTCNDKIGHDKEEKPNSEDLVTTDISQIVDEFKHDKLKSLKDMPKVFLVQACRGPAHEMVEAAGLKRSISITKVEEDDLPYKPKCPVDADIMICYATTLDHPSLVCQEKGSWFIQDLLEVFKNHHKSQHIGDMMTVINLAISERRGSLKVGKNRSIEALQMPCVWSSFRKRFYLHSM